MIKWKTLSEKTIYESKLFRVKEKEFKLPNGKVKIYPIVERRPTAIVFPLDEKNNVYLIRQYRYLFDSELLESVAGFIEYGEEAEDTAKRELLEEAGIKAGIWTKIAQIEGSSSVSRIPGNLFVARDLTFEKPKLDESEQIEIVKLSLAEATDKIINGEIRNSSTITGILLIDTLIKRGKL